MTQRTINLEKQILTLFKLACRQGRSDIAEHLLLALEALDQRPDISGPPVDQRILIEAYSEIIHH